MPFTFLTVNIQFDKNKEGFKLKDIKMKPRFINHNILLEEQLPYNQIKYICTSERGSFSFNI